MATQQNIGSGVDQPKKAGVPETGSKDSAKARRVEQERSAFDLKHKPTERDAQIDGSGARFETDG
jgi:hypothetical protein